MFQKSFLRRVIAVAGFGVGLSLTPSTQAQRETNVRLVIRDEELVAEPPSASLPPDTAGSAMTLASLEERAVTANPAIVRQSALVGAARGNWVQVGLPPNPTVGYEGQQLGSGGRAEQHGFGVSQEVVRGGKLRLNRAVAELELERERQELAVIQQRVVTDVRIAFYQVLVAQRQIDVTEKVEQINRQGAKTVDLLLQAKEASRAEVLQAQLEVENARVLSHNARNRHDAAWRTLASVVGEPELPVQPLDGDAYAPPKQVDFHEALANLQSSSPEISASMTEIERARAALLRAYAEPIPNATFQGLVNVIDNGIGGKPDASLSMSMPFPLFNRNQGGILKARHELAAAEQAFRQKELGLSNRLAPIYERYANARNQVDRYRAAILPTAQESLELTRQSYEAGESAYLALLTAQRTFAQTNLNYLDAVRDLRTAEVEIEGMLLRDSLNSTAR